VNKRFDNSLWGITAFFSVFLCHPFPGAPVQAARAERITFFAAVKVLYALVKTKA